MVALLNGYAADPMGGNAPLPAAVRARLAPALSELPGALVLLARAGRTPVGVAVCFIGFSTFRARPLTNVHDLAVAPGWRGRGIGRRLLDEVVAAARAQGHCAQGRISYSRAPWIHGPEQRRGGGTPECTSARA